MKLAALTIALVTALTLITGCSIETNNEEKLPIYMVKNEDGFSFKLDIPEGVNGLVVQSLPAPHDGNIVAHLVRRITDEPDGKRFQLDVIIVQPDKQRYKNYSVADVIVKDDYSVDSIARAYGFNSQDKLVLVRPKERADRKESVQYDVISLNVHTGKIKTIAADAVPDVSPSFFAKGWMNQTGQLYLNSYSDGRLWSVDTGNGEVRSIKGEFNHEWPLYLLTPSPNGDLLWHEEKDDHFSMYGQDGKLLKVIPHTLGYHSYPAFEWSPDSRYSALAFTLSDNPDNILGGEDAYIIAPEMVAIYNQNGDFKWEVQAKPKEGLTNVDWNGWLSEEGEGVISWYRLDHTEEGAAPRKTDLQYALADVAAGTLKDLHPAKRVEDLKSPVPVVNRIAQLLLIDREAGLYWSPAAEQVNTSIKLLSKPGDPKLIWATRDYTLGETIITRYNPADHSTVTNVFKELLGEEHQLINDTMVADNLNYRRIH
ncbi:TolB family protein [Paenibacillus sp. YAF4_2]|uniref:TolB family protein n=1 Tax=Paenibacillus sp. YAF4_2 TaxID=3233085 RepID=UPI003F9DF6EF